MAKRKSALETVFAAFFEAQTEEEGQALFSAAKVVMKQRGWLRKRGEGAAKRVGRAAKAQGHSGEEKRPYPVHGGAATE